MDIHQNLEATGREMLLTLSSSPEISQDGTFSDLFLSGGELLIKSVEEEEKKLSHSSSISTSEIRSRIDLWQSSLEPWHELLKSLKNFGTIPCDSVSKLLDSLPGVIQTIFSHCKKSETLYTAKFGDVRQQLTNLYRQTDLLVEIFFAILENNVNYGGEMEREKIILSIVLNKIGDIAVLTNGIDLKILINTWKIFAKLAAVNESLVKKLAVTESVTRRYVDIAQDIRIILSSLENKNVNNLRVVKCIGLLLKILSRLCTIYRGYCGSKVCRALVKILVVLYRYLLPFQSKISEYSETHIAPAVFDLLNVLMDEKEFPRAFLQSEVSDKDDPIYYHVLTLKVIEELTKDPKKRFHFWIQEESSLIDVALSNVNRCCKDLLIEQVRIPCKSMTTPKSGVYETTFKFVCLLISRTSVEDFSALETILMKHLIGGEFWSCLLSCDCWTYLGRISSPELCYEHLSFLMRVQKALLPREKSLEFEIVANLIGRLYKTLPENMQELFSEEVALASDVRLIQPLRESLPAGVEEKLLKRISLDATSDLGRTFQDLRLTPSIKNWSRLTSLLRSIGAATTSKGRLACTDAIRNIWSFLASSLPRSEGIIRETLLELTVLLLDCTQPNSSDNSSNDRLIASIYTNILEIIDSLPASHRIKINVFIRDSLESFLNESGEQSLSTLTELFTRLITDEDPWVRQETFETYAECVVKNSSPQLFDALSIGINKSPRACRQMQLYLSNKGIYNLSRHSSLDAYLRQLANLFGSSSNFHKCYEPDFRQRDEKMPRLEVTNIEQRVDDVCREIRYLTERKDELSDASVDKLRTVLLQLLQPISQG